MVMFAQVPVYVNYNAGTYAYEPGYEIIGTNGVVYACLQSGLGIGASQTISIPYGTYEVRGFDNFGDGWNGGSLAVEYLGQPIFTTSGPPNGGYYPSDNSCNGIPSPVNNIGSSILGTFTLAPVTCQMTCPADVTVDNDPGTCEANVTVGQPTTSECAGTETVYTQDFNGCAQPTGWTLSTSTGTYNTAGPCGTSLFSFECANTSSFFGTANPNFTGCIAIIADDDVSAFVGTATMTSPVINLSAGGASLSFDYSVYSSSSTV
jgi:hypothetical protein